jgi:hypothetical protein
MNDREKKQNGEDIMETFEVEAGVRLPLTVKLLDCSELEDDSEWIVWLVGRTPEGKERPVVTVSDPTHCKMKAEITAAAFRCLLAAPGGEAQAIEFVRHHWGEESDEDHDC